MKLDMKYVSTYTVPAGEDSISSFKNYKCYFFSDIGDGKFNTDEIKKSDYLGLGTPHKIDDGNYIKIKYVGDIKDINKFNIDYDDSTITFKDLELNSEVKRAFKVHIDAFHRYSNGNIGADTPLSWNYILVNNTIKVEENILYPLRELVAIPLSNEGKYIKTKDLLDRINISEDISFNTKNNYFNIDGEKLELDGVNNNIYNFVIKHIFTSDDNIFSVNDKQEEYLKILKKVSSDDIKSDFLKDTIVKRFNERYSDKVRFRLFFSLSKKIDGKEKANVIYIK